MREVVAHDARGVDRGIGFDRILRPGTLCDRGSAQSTVHGGFDGLRRPLALGLALARPDLRVLALDGDGAALMRMGAFATVGAYGPANFRHLLLDNGVHDSTGGQATVSPLVAFAQIAAACGYAQRLETDGLRRSRLVGCGRRSTDRDSRDC